MSAEWIFQRYAVKERANSVGHSRVEGKKEIECETGQGKIMSFY